MGLSAVVSRSEQRLLKRTKCKMPRWHLALFFFSYVIDAVGEIWDNTAIH